MTLIMIVITLCPQSTPIEMLPFKSKPKPIRPESIAFNHEVTMISAEYSDPKEKTNIFNQVPRARKVPNELIDPIFHQTPLMLKLSHSFLEGSLDKLPPLFDIQHVLDLTVGVDPPHLIHHLLKGHQYFDPYLISVLLSILISLYLIPNKMDLSASAPY